MKQYVILKRVNTYHDFNSIYATHSHMTVEGIYTNFLEAVGKSTLIFKESIDSQIRQVDGQFHEFERTDFASKEDDDDVCYWSVSLIPNTNSSLKYSLLIMVSIMEYDPFKEV